MCCYIEYRCYLVDDDDYCKKQHTHTYHTYIPKKKKSGVRVVLCWLWQKDDGY